MGMFLGNLAVAVDLLVVAIAVFMLYHFSSNKKLYRGAAWLILITGIALGACAKYTWYQKYSQKGACLHKYMGEMHSNMPSSGQ